MEKPTASAPQGGACPEGLGWERPYQLLYGSGAGCVWAQDYIHDCLFLNIFFSCLVQLKHSWQNLGIANDKLELHCSSRLPRGDRCGASCCSSAVTGTSGQPGVPAAWNDDALQPWGFSIHLLAGSCGSCGAGGTGICGSCGAGGAGSCGVGGGVGGPAEGCWGLAQADIRLPSSGLILWWQRPLA